MTDTQTAPERIFVAYAGDHMRYWGREPSPSLDCTEYRRADARPVPADGMDVEGLARAAEMLLDAKVYDLTDTGGPLDHYGRAWMRGALLWLTSEKGKAALSQKETGR